MYVVGGAVEHPDVMRDRAENLAKVAPRPIRQRDGPDGEGAPLRSSLLLPSHSLFIGELLMH